MSKFRGIWLVLGLLLISACEDKAPQEDKLPTATPTASEEAVIIATSAPALTSGLTLTKQGKPDGDFKLVIDKKTGENNQTVIEQTLVSESVDGQERVVHIVRRTNEQDKWMSRDAIIVEPSTQSYRSIQLYELMASDLTYIDSLARVYGFVDEQHLVYITAEPQEGNTDVVTYGVEQLNIVTGEQRVLLEELPSFPQEELFGDGWLDVIHNRLVINTDTTRQLWSIHLDEGESIYQQIGADVSSHYELSPSPSGDYFWYSDHEKREHRLYDAGGMQLAVEGYGEGYNNPVVAWSPDGQFAYIQDTLDVRSEFAVTLGAETGQPQYGTQRIRIFNVEGRLIHTELSDWENHMCAEVVGWLEGIEGIALLHEYTIGEPQIEDDVQEREVTSQGYALLNAETGIVQELELSGVISNLDENGYEQGALSGNFIAVSPGAYYAKELPTRVPLFALDQQSGALWKLTNNGAWYTKPRTSNSFTDTIQWLAYDTDEKGQLVLLQTIHTQDGLLKTKAFQLKDSVLYTADEWLVTNDMMYMSIK